MGYLMIARIYNPNKVLVGYRLLDYTKNSTLDVPTNSLISTISSKKATVDNLEVALGKLTGTNGVLSRYAEISIDNKLISTKSPVVIISKIEDTKYRVSNAFGKIVILQEKEVIEYSKRNGIANGKVVERHGKEVVSSINGYYREEKEVKERKADNVADKKEQPIKLTTAKPTDIEILRKKLEEYTTKDIVNKLPDTDIQRMIDEIASNHSVFSDKNMLGILSYIGFVGEDLKLPGDEEYNFIIKLLKNSLPIPYTLANNFWAMIKNITNNDIERFYTVLFNTYSANIHEIFTTDNLEGMEVYDRLVAIYHKGNIDATDINKAYDYIEYYIKLKWLYNIFENIIAKLNYPKLTTSNMVKEFIEHIKELDKNTASTILIILSYRINEIALNNNQLEVFNAFNTTASIDNKLKFVDTAAKDGNIHKITREFIRVVTSNSVKYTLPSDSLEDVILRHEGSKTAENENTARIGTGHIIDRSNKVTDTQEKETLTEEIPEKTVEKVSDDIKKDRIAYLSELLNKATIDKKQTSITIAEDIIKRKLSYSKLSYKQKYRINDAIAICEKNLGIISNTTDKQEDTVNEHYELSDRPDILAKIKRIMDEADTPIMDAVYEVTPKVLNICLSVEKNGKVSTRQLRHIDMAIEILDKQ